MIKPYCKRRLWRLEARVLWACANDARQGRCHIKAMSEPTGTYPYVLDVQPNPRVEGI